MLPDLIFRLVPTVACCPRYLNQLINHPLYHSIISDLATGTTGSMPNISKQRLLDLAIPLPPVKVQQSIEPLLEQSDKSKFCRRRIDKKCRRHAAWLHGAAFKSARIKPRLARLAAISKGRDQVRRVFCGDPADKCNKETDGKKKSLPSPPPAELIRGGIFLGRPQKSADLSIWRAASIKQPTALCLYAPYACVPRLSAKGNGLLSPCLCRYIHWSASLIRPSIPRGSPNRRLE